MPRIEFIDHLRNFAGFLRLFIHSAVPYMVTVSPIWPVDDRGILLIDFFVFEGHLFVMELYFLIAGFMFYRQIQFMEPGAFLRNRMRRIGLPFLAGMLLMVPFVLMFFGLGRYPDYRWMSVSCIADSFIQGFSLGMRNFFPTAHLWFLYYLMLFYLSGAAILKSGLFHFIQNTSLRRFLLIGGAGSFAAMFFSGRWILENPLTLLPEFSSFLHFFLFFLGGMLLQVNEERCKITRPGFFIIAGLMLGLGSACCQLFKGKEELVFYGFLEAAAQIFYAAASWLLSFGIWFFAKENFRRSTFLSRRLADASFRVYFWSLPVVMLLQLLLLPLDVPVILKLAIVFTASGFITLSPEIGKRNREKQTGSRG